MEFDIATASIFSAFIGAGVAGLIQVVVRSMDRGAEERRHIREIVMRTALESWRESMAFGKMKYEHGERVAIFPLESYIIPLRKLARLVERDDLDVAEARKCAQEYLAITDAVAEEFRRYDQEQKKKNQPSDTANRGQRGQQC